MEKSKAENYSVTIDRAICEEIQAFQAGSHGVTVSTLDFESSDGGSNPPGSYYLLLLLDVFVFERFIY